MTTTTTTTTTGVVLALAVAPSVSSRRWTPVSMAWGDMLQRAAHPEDHKDCGGYVAGRLRGTTRRKGEVEYRSMVTLDADSASEGLPAAVGALGLTCLVHSTYSHTPSHPRYRVIIPIMGRGLSEAEYPRVVKGLMQRLGVAQFDPGSTQPERLMFWPSTSDPATYEHMEFVGEWATADGLLREFGGLGPEPPHMPGAKRDPYQLPGVPGAFNRLYDMAKAVEVFRLPYDQVGENRWHYSPSSSEGGVLVYPDGRVYSNHASDPAYGMALSVFDLVAIHLFAADDAGVAPGCAPADRPSIQHALRDFAGRREIVEELARADFVGESGEVELPEWQLELTRSSKTGKVIDDVHNWDLLRKHDPVLRSMARNLMTQCVTTREDLPWRRVTPGRDDAITMADRAEISAHLQRAYGMPRPGMDMLNGVLEAEAQLRQYHPVEEYLDSLEWDGVSRVETCLPGVEDSPYTRRIARLCLVQAVARIYEPGVKVDNCLILVGGQGLGKTWWVDRVSRGWTCSLGPIGDKDTIMAMTRSWIVVADEGFAMKKADNDQLKQFITQRQDVIRLPYDRQETTLLRRSVIWGTTNDPVFLRSQEGNRRFLIAHVVRKADFDLYTDEYVDQLWAEAVALYRAGDRLFLDEAEEAMAETVRAASTEEDSLTGLIQAYLDTLVPEDWDSLRPESKRAWLMDAEQGRVVGTHQMMMVCSLEIWEVALGNRRGDHSRTDILQITSALKGLPGWSGPGPRPLRTPFYGVQRVFRRISN